METTAFHTALHALRPTEQSVLAQIEREVYWQPRSTLMTVCALVMKNGFVVTGEAACASPDVFDAKLGRKYARENALKKLIALECYALREKLKASVR